MKRARQAAAKRVRNARDLVWLMAIDGWRKCSAKRLTWRSGGHCVHCAPLRNLLDCAVQIQLRKFAR